MSVLPSSVFSRDTEHGGAKLAKRQLELTRNKHITGKVGAACGCFLKKLLPRAFAAPAGRLGTAASSATGHDVASAASAAAAGVLGGAEAPAPPPQVDTWGLGMTAIMLNVFKVSEQLDEVWGREFATLTNAGTSNATRPASISRSDIEGLPT